MRKIGRPKEAKDLKPHTKKKTYDTNRSFYKDTNDKPKKIQPLGIEDCWPSPVELVSARAYTLESAGIDPTETMLSEIFPSGLADPFHDDWPYWSK